MKGYPLSLMLLLPLAACGGAPPPLAEQGSVIQIFEADRPDHDYKIYVRNTVAGDLDMGRTADRRAAVQSLLQGDCNTVTVVDESFIAFGNERAERDEPKHGKFLIRVRCNKW